MKNFFFAIIFLLFCNLLFADPTPTPTPCIIQCYEVDVRHDKQRMTWEPNIDKSFYEGAIGMTYSYTADLKKCIIICKIKKGQEISFALKAGAVATYISNINEKTAEYPDLIKNNTLSKYPVELNK